ncbi:hypothetical protein GWI33_003996 [Rhynchophorus ferrugineus]|uniref:Odorant receptor n=1 Tax=Rhynchophorus ferrugineus TaxID=354439 RepID=A0A834HMR2_RHYFE|nr:hypothetical protein GWI33_003996 [Rhynchophorus ferrugineus]
MMLTHLLGLLKFFVLATRHEAIGKIQDKLQDKTFHYEPFDKFQPGLMVQEQKKNSGVLCTFLFCFYSFVGIIAHISAVMLVKKNTINEVFIMNTTCASFLPYSFYFPFDVSTKDKCYYSLIFMDVCLVIFAFYIATLDAVFVSLLHLLKTQLTILTDALKTIRGRCLNKLGLEGNFSVLYDQVHPRLEKEMYQHLTHSTKHVQSLVEVGSDIENLFTFVTLMQTLSSLFIFASSLYSVVKEPITSPNFFSQLQYFIAVLCQFSVYCWFGNQITLAAAEIPFALYKSDWFGCSQRYKKSMLMTMTRMRKPLYISIGKFSPLTLTTLLAVIKASFSYFTLFQSLSLIGRLEDTICTDGCFSDVSNSQYIVDTKVQCPIIQELKNTRFTHSFHIEFVFVNYLSF